jgi:hydroxyethylthiazole kinase
VTFGIAGELAAQGRPGPGSFQVRLLDALDALTDVEIIRRGRIEE